MSRYASVQIGVVHLTTDGSSGAVKCRARIENGDAFATTITGNSVSGANSQTYTELVERGVKGIAFAFRVDFLTIAVLTSIKTAVNVTLNGNSTVRVIASDAVNSLDVQAVPSLPDWLSHESVSGGIVKNVVLKFISTGQGGI